MRLALRSAPACGQRWVLQALLVWQWANHMAARAAGREDTRFSDRFTVLVPATHRQHWEDALLGPVAVAGLRTVGDTGVLRRMRLFLPPALRAPFRFWLLMQACVGDALRVLADDTAGATATLVAGRGPRLACGLPAPVFTGTGVVPLQAPPSLRVTWLDHAQANPDAEFAGHGACIADFGPARAIRYGVAKLPVLACAPARRPLRESATSGVEARHGARPALRRDHTAQLRLGLRALAQRRAGFASIDPDRTPRMRVLCDSPELLRAARSRLRGMGVAARDIAPTGSVPHRARIDFGLLSPARASPSRPPDPRVCVLVVLRSRAPGAGERAPAQALGMPALWPEPELARLRAGNRERAAFGQPPDTLLDVLTVVEHRDALPLYAPWRQLGLAVLDPRPPEAVPAIGDVVMTTLRPDATRFEITLPPTCADIAVLETPERLSALSRRLLRASRSLPVRKSIHPRAGWDEDDNGLRTRLHRSGGARPAHRQPLPARSATPGLPPSRHPARAGHGRARTRRCAGPDRNARLPHRIHGGPPRRRGARGWRRTRCACGDGVPTRCPPNSATTGCGAGEAADAAVLVVQAPWRAAERAARSAGRHPQPGRARSRTAPGSRHDVARARSLSHATRVAPL